VIAIILTIFNQNYRHQTFHVYSDILQKGASWYDKNNNSLFVSDAFEKWLSSRDDLPAYINARKPYPIFLAVGEGGGVRAAYCLATTLAQYQDLMPSFRKHLFAISGVSGGSVGAILFFNLCRSAQEAKAIARNTKWLDLTDRILSHDFLNPCLAALLGPEVLQRVRPRFLFGHWLGIDRGVTLQDAFLRAAQLHLGSSEPVNVNLFDSYDPTKNLPLLFLNATAADSGARKVLTPRAVNADALENYLAAPSDIGVNDAAFISARFPLISPICYLQDSSDCEVALVDGGCYDNTGIATLNEVLAGLSNRRESMAKNHAGLSFRFIVIRPRYHLRPTESKSGKIAMHLDVLPVLGAINAAREQYASAAKIQINDSSDTLETIEFGHHTFPDVASADGESKIVASDLEVPLGWSLSKKDRDFLHHDLYQVASSVARLEDRDPLLLH
jgi:hypothetical protein